ncbi:MAG TPA: hypothetical protein VMP01_02785 [Pirellulaceae bacterium]|nr:hypothetical protein [Pirellulaceae bacterium]
MRDNDSILLGGPLKDLRIAGAQRRRTWVSDSDDVKWILPTGLML